MRFYLIDALRGVAALWVVLFHSFEGGHIIQLTETIPQFLVHFVFEMGDTTHLDRVLNAVRRIDAVYDVYRVSAG